MCHTRLPGGKFHYLSAVNIFYFYHRGTGIETAPFRFAVPMVAVILVDCVGQAGSSFYFGYREKYRSIFSSLEQTALFFPGENSTQIPNFPKTNFLLKKPHEGLGVGLNQRTRER